MPAASDFHPLQLRLLGPFEVAVDGKPMPRPRSHAGQVILAVLALSPDRPVERAWLASLLWPDSDHEQALFNLRRNLTDLRKILGREADRLLSPTARSLQLDLRGARCDLTEFDALSQRPESDALEQAIRLYNGPLLAACSEEWVVQERTVREQALLAALETLAARALHAGRPADAVALLRRALAVDPFREAAVRALLEALAAAGDPVGANLAYREFRLRLHRELLSEPAPETQALYRRLRERSLAPSQPPPSSTVHLPQPLSGLLGRATELQEVRGCLERSRLVTLTGSGGVGKTRLAIEVARELAQDFPDGVWFVDLAPLAEAELAASTIATSLQVQLQGRPGAAAMEALLGALKSRALLMVLDNCEHLASECAALLHRLLPACPHLRVLATSRQALGVRGEIVWRVPSLALPPALPSDPGDYPAVQLFVERARAAESSFQRTDRNARSVAGICRRLDGIPLAIELAAARVRSLPVEEIHARLENNFRLLTVGDAGHLRRQETLATTFAWSWDLLTAPERLLLGRLSVFAGGWTLAAAAAVCAGDGIESEAIVDLLSALVDRSMVLYQPSEARYRLLETTRQFASEWLCERGATPTIHRRHRDHFLEWAEEVHPRLWGTDQALWFARLEADHNNFRAALDWCRKQRESEKELRLTAALCRFWDTYGHLGEGRAHLEAAIANAGPDVPVRLYADTLVNAGWIAQEQGDPHASLAFNERALALFQQTQDLERLPGVLNFLGCARRNAGDVSGGLALLEEARELCERHGLGYLMATLVNLGVTLTTYGDLPAAKATLEKAIALRTERTSRQLLGVAFDGLADIAVDEERWQDAEAHNRESLRMYARVRALVNVPGALIIAGIIAFRQGRPERAARLLGAAVALMRTLDVSPDRYKESGWDAIRESLRAALGEGLYALRIAEGAALGVDAAIDEALEGQI